jgi:catechol-2,3-dioxygenase
LRAVEIVSFFGRMSQPCRYQAATIAASSFFIGSLSPSIDLRAGNVAVAEAFYCGTLGLDVTRRRTGATFLSSGG